MKANGIITESDSIRSQYLHIKPNWFFGTLGISIVILAVYFLIISFSIWLFLCVLYLLFHFGLYMPYRAKRIYREGKRVRGEVELDIDDSGLSWKTDRGFSETRWGDIFKWRKGGSMVLIYFNSALYAVVPAHFFSSGSDFQRFCNLLESKIGKST